MQSFRRPQTCALVPARLVHDQGNAVVRSNLLFFGEDAQRLGKGCRIDIHLSPATRVYPTIPHGRGRFERNE